MGASMKFVLVGASALAMSGCALTGFVPSSERDVMGGPNGDLRVMPCPAETRSGAALAVWGEKVLADLGSSAFKSFGAFLEEASKPNITRSMGSTGGAFYSSPNDKNEVELNSNMTCLFLVRNGFEPMTAAQAQARRNGAFNAVYDGDPPAELTATWSKLGLTKTPDLFVQVKLVAAEGASSSGAAEPQDDADGKPLDTGEERPPGAPKFPDNRSTGPAAPAPAKEAGEEGAPEEAADDDKPNATGAGAKSSESRPGGDAGPSFAGGHYRPIAPPYFRLELEKLYVNEFQNSQIGGNERDLAIVFNYALASTQATIERIGRNAGVTEFQSKFAAGGIRIAGVSRGYYDDKMVKGLQTAWMPMPPTKEIDTRATVDLAVYAVEFAPGNAFLEQVGKYLSSETVVSGFKDVLTSEIDLQGDKGRARQAAELATIKEETAMVTSLTEERTKLETALKPAEGVEFDKDAAVEQAKKVDELVRQISTRREKIGWISTSLLGELDRSRAVLADPRLKP